MVVPNRQRILISVILLVVSLGIAYFLDSIYSLLADRARESFQIMPAAWFGRFRPFVLALVLIGLSWFTLVKFPPVRWVSVLYIFIGLFVQNFLFAILLGFPVILRNPLFAKVQLAIDGPMSSVSIVGAGLIVLGIIGLFKKTDRQGV